METIIMFLGFVFLCSLIDDTIRILFGLEPKGKKKND